MAIGDREEPAFSQAGIDGGEVVAGDDARQRHLFVGLVVRLTGEPVKRRLIGYCQRNPRNRAGADDTGDSADLRELRIDECYPRVEVGIAEQRRHERQHAIAVDSQIELP